MSEIKSYHDFDLWVAMQKSRGKMIRLNYGLIPSKSIVIGENPNAGLNSSDKNYHCQPSLDWQNINRILIRTCITIGIFINSD